jgi:hypothetical protein
MKLVPQMAPANNVCMYFVVDPDKEVSPQHAALVWKRLWEMRDLAPVSAMLPAAVTSPCPLLPDEAASGVLAVGLVQVPDGSAWVSLEVDLLRFARADGTIRTRHLDTALRAAVQDGEQGHDASHWGSPAQHQDSWSNRRLSVFVRGWGDIVARRQADPGALVTLSEMHELAAHVTSVLVDASRDLAVEKGYCPALDVTGARVLQHGREMNARWRRAVVDTAVRHRNLLTLSPWDVFPRCGPADLRYANLLPLIKHAHSISLRRDVRLCHWNAREFRRFHDRVAAIMRHSSDQSLIAKQV